MSKLTEILEKVKIAQRSLALLSDEAKSRVLIDLSDAILKNQQTLLAANEKDLAKMDPSDPNYDRLQLTKSRIEGIATDLKRVASFDSPLGRVLEERTLKNGLHLQKVTVPLGVIAVIYEARPNVTYDVFSLCFKSGNACILKGGSEAYESNQATIDLIHRVLEKRHINPFVAHMLSTDREEVNELLQADQYVDVIIPRGSHALITFVREHSKIPVIETGAGIVHLYFDVSGDLEIGKKSIFNAKTRRPAVCNALDTIIIHKDRLNDLTELCAPLAEKHVEIFADEASYQTLNGKYPAELLQHAKEKDFGCEFLSLKMSVKAVNNLDEALEHIRKHSSRHSESIIANDEQAIETFFRDVDAAVIYSNAPTSFTDGGEFGMGAEIGISTQKLHARGPMALKELTSYKWFIRGSGQIRQE